MTRLVMVAACGLAAISLAISGCKSSNNAGSVVSSSKAAPTGAASAEQVANEMRGSVRCPARASEERPSGSPVDDVVGVRPGMSWDEAANFAMCDNPLMVVTESTSRGYNINTYGLHVRQGFEARFAEPRVVKTSQQIMKDMQDEAMRRGGNAYVAPLQPGQARYYVSTMGLPGREQVMAVAREEYFPANGLPTLESVKQALIGKYGEPSETNSNGTVTYLWWEYEPGGAKITSNSPGHASCRVNVSPDAGTTLTDACGLEIGALITGARDNPGLAHSLAVTSQNSAAGYAKLTATEDALKKADEARKAQELSAASKGASAPKI
jgi:hypothetical protein